MTERKDSEWSYAQWQGKEVIVTFMGDGVTVAGQLVGRNEAAGWIMLEVNPNAEQLVVYLHAVRSVQLSQRAEEEAWQPRFMQTDRDRPAG